MRDTGYRTREQIQAWVERDPLKLFRQHMLAAGSASEEEIEAVDAEVKAEIAEAVEFATDSPWPDPATVADHIFSE